MHEGVGIISSGVCEYSVNPPPPTLISDAEVLRRAPARVKRAVVLQEAERRSGFEQLVVCYLFTFLPWKICTLLPVYPGHFYLLTFLPFDPRHCPARGLRGKEL